MHIDILKCVGARKFQNAAHHTACNDTPHTLRLDDNSSIHRDRDKLLTEHKWLRACT
jgi:hypothetical protein